MSSQAKTRDPCLHDGDGAGVVEGQKMKARKMKPQYMGRFRSGMPRLMARVAVAKDTPANSWISVSLGVLK